MNDLIENMKKEVKHDIDALKHKLAGTSPASAQPHLASTGINDLGHRKLAELVQEFHACLPTFERAGFVLLNFEVEIGLSPKFIPHFHITKHLSQEERKAVLQEIRNQRVAKLILEALFKASYLSEHIYIGNLVFRGLEVHVSALPTVRMLFSRQRKMSSQQQVNNKPAPATLTVQSMLA